MHDYTQLDLSPRLRAILDYATMLTRDPHSVQESDVEALRGQGLTDEEILSVVLITCNFNFMTRLADGLGVEIQENRFEDAKRWMSADVQAMSWLMDHKEK